jgi:flavorubredoxin
VRDKGKMAGGFGSYGWSGEGSTLIKNALTSLKLKYFDEGVFIKFSPDGQELEQSFEYGKAFGEKLSAN